jgi:hypothetical protein
MIFEIHIIGSSTCERNRWMRLKLLEAFDFVSNPEESLEKLTDLTLHRNLINRQMRRILARLRKPLKWL